MSGPEERCARCGHVSVPEASKALRELVAAEVFPKWDGENWVIFISGGEQQDERPFFAPFGEEPFSLYSDGPIFVRRALEEPDP